MSQNVGKVALVAENIRRLCQSRPETAFYFQQLLNYINTNSDLPHGSAIPGIRAFHIYESRVQDTTTTATTRLKQVDFPPVDVDPGTWDPSLVVVQGHLCPEAVVELALLCNLPQFFLGFLELERVRLKFRNSYELPALPSRRGNIVNIRLVSLWRFNSPRSRDYLPVNVEPGERREADRACREYEKQLFEQYQAGATRFRKVHLHDSKHFTVEQSVSLCVVPGGKGGNGAPRWRTIFLLDGGRDLPGLFQYPWNSALRPPGLSPSLLSAVRYNERASSFSIDSTTNTISKAAAPVGENHFRMHPYDPLSVYGGVNGARLLSRPFFAVASVLASAAVSWNQVLNFIEEDIAKHQDVTDEETSSALAQVRFNAGVIQRFQGFIQLDLETIRDDSWHAMSISHGFGNWNNGNNLDEVEISLDKEQETTFAELVRDYESLVTRCKSLTSRCESSSSILQSAIGLLESQESRRQSEEVNKVTKLAFFFIPVSLVSSVFGMNVIEINPESVPSIWHFVVTSVLLLLLCVFLDLAYEWFSRASKGINILFRSYHFFRG
ncbi:hypothetical protein GGR52DRAFT_67797 [Hypoxylon sp. FL1284]|nr:hypothetical protein GGR52DRAFT_67797 [Hypoxylon sp. FL1284]